MTSFDAYTDRAGKALADSFELAKGYAHSQLVPTHLAVSLIDPPKDLANQIDIPPPPLFRQVLERANGDAQLFERALKKALVRLPSQDPPPERTSPSPAMAKVLRAAEELSKTQKDSFIAVDHLIQSLCQDTSIQRCLAESDRQRDTGAPRHQAGRLQDGRCRGGQRKSEEVHHRHDGNGSRGQD
jgi:ATP-dependent Clp protease ATP-binding subunit ClpB